MIEIYTDGACVRNPGPGGWAAIVRLDNGTLAISGNEARSTNQRMEVKAAIKALGQIPQGTECVIYSDSQYLVNTMTQGWKRRANLDLWRRLDALVAQRKVGFQWIQGHASNLLNIKADRLANSMANLAAQGHIVEEQNEAG